MLHSISVWFLINKESLTRHAYICWGVWWFVQGSLACLKLRGYMVSFGQSSGSPDPVPLSSLAAKSLFLTRPSLMQYVVTRDELLEAAGELFANVASGVLKVRVNHTYPLSEAAKAHEDLENRKTSGSIVLIPWHSRVLCRGVIHQILVWFILKRTIDYEFYASVCYSPQVGVLK